MPHLELGKRLDRDYGARYEARVVEEIEGKNHTITTGTYREPRHPDRATAGYVLGTGVTGGKNAMRLTGIEGAKHGHPSLAINFSNLGFANALDANTQDIIAALAALPEPLHKRYIGLSMSGRLGTRAIAQVSFPVESATVVAPAGYESENHMSWLEGAVRLGSVAPEAVSFGLRQPKNAAYAGLGCLRNTFSRFVAVGGEMHELRHGDEHENFQSIAAMPQHTFMRLLLGTNDPLFRLRSMQASVQHLPFDEVMLYQGGHIAIVSDPAVSRAIFAADDQLATHTPLPSHPSLAAA